MPLIAIIRAMLSAVPTPSAVIYERLPQYTSREVYDALRFGCISDKFEYEIGRGWTA